MPWLFSFFLKALSKTSANEWMKIGGKQAPLSHSATQGKNLRRPANLLHTTVQNNLNHVTNDTPKLKYYKVLSIKGHFMLSKAFSKSMKVNDQEFVLYLHTWWCFLWAWYFHRYFPYSIFQKTCLIAIDNLRKNFFNAISKWFSCDSKITVEESNGSPVFQKIGRLFVPPPPHIILKFLRKTKPWNEVVMILSAEVFAA